MRSVHSFAVRYRLVSELLVHVLAQFPIHGRFVHGVPWGCTMVRVLHLWGHHQVPIYLHLVIRRLLMIRPVHYAVAHLGKIARQVRVGHHVLWLFFRTTLYTSQVIQNTNRYTDDDSQQHDCCHDRNPVDGTSDLGLGNVRQKRVFQILRRRATYV